MEKELLGNPIRKRLFSKARTEMMLDYIDCHFELLHSGNRNLSLMSKIDEIRNNAIQITLIAKQAEAMGIKIVPADAIKEKTSPQALRRLILEYTTCEEEDT